ncbi:MAG: flagellar biosynthesis protein FlhB [Nevskiaceae bacterium]|nr:MAG: flagellar biosynthesis protein FlhB [Nevskiaceae bacterium]TBR72186.1 MAG: flagellar biosynthesis protein FlhB [Nevskiaceae bacterium]
MAEDSGQKTEQPTDKKVREAREKGQLPRSRDLSGALVLAAGVTTLGGGTLAGLVTWLRNSLQTAGHIPTADIPLHLAATLVTPFKLLAGCFLAMFIAGLIGQLVPGGWNLSGKALMPDLNRLNPVNNIGRMFTRGPVEFLKTVAKAAVVAAATYFVIMHERPMLEIAALMPTAVAVREILSFGIKVAIAGTLGLLLVGLADAPYQWWQTHRDLRMTKQEVRDESRESDGKPEIKSKIRQMQQRLSRGRMMEAVDKADVVLVNPIHVAVALQYLPGSMKAPKVVAKGAGIVAEAIRDRAREHHVPLLTAPPLARALYRTTKVGGDVPVALYRAIAQTLAWVYQLRSGSPNVHEPDVEVPSAFEEAARPWE